ncbi:hypothetical protein COV24_03475 [candidate division WWE3 bacterium CG10_big_fil_rev_8_21_14_0_10_32_10]|uniref:Uncharacterized protein n=1 Tax=candidate division WWE3 bacterium CG10_big_fil_rev_8_21_14_0_10_32_10 TaxID=1975090 RepID=A0A2H0R9V4_UNCKA|nr:MAG: hypothetical protein COV24_03475 [candidate division WWE3 bacterium CG10_big_fil_rev_8_21_14_0_10_32_10]
MGFDRLFITVKDRKSELATVCKSLLHSDMRSYIREVVFLDDHSEDMASIQRIYSAFMYACLPIGIKARFLPAKDGRYGINQSLDRIKYYKSDRIWILNGDMIVLSNYFGRCSDIHNYGINQYGDDGLMVSGFHTFLHGYTDVLSVCGALKKKSISGQSNLVSWNNLDRLLKCFSSPTMNRGWDLHIGENFKTILVTNPSASQHIGIFEGLNQVGLSGFPGSWADLRS